MPWDPSKLDQAKKPDKGRRNGSCNRTACQDPGAIWYNRGSYAFYCESCAEDLNKANAVSWTRCSGYDGRPMCIRIDPSEKFNEVML